MARNGMNLLTFIELNSTSRISADALAFRWISPRVDECFSVGSEVSLGGVPFFYWLDNRVMSVENQRNY